MTVSGGAVQTDRFVGAGKKDVYRRGVQQILPIESPVFVLRISAGDS